MSVEFLTKISAKTIFGDVKSVAPKEGEEQKKLFKIIGYAKDIVVKKTQYGDSIGLVGQFEAQRISDGHTFVSATLYLPEPLGSLLGLTVKNKLENKEATSIEIAYIIGIKHAGTATGYQYTMEAMIDPRGQDPLAALRAISNNFMIDAPKSDNENEQTCHETSDEKIDQLPDDQVIESMENTSEEMTYESKRKRR